MTHLLERSRHVCRACVRMSHTQIVAHSVKEWRRHNTVLLCNLCSCHQTCYRVTIAHWLANGYNIGQNIFTTDNKVRRWSANVDDDKETTYIPWFSNIQKFLPARPKPTCTSSAIHKPPASRTYLRMYVCIYYTIKGYQTLKSMHQSCTQAEQLIYIRMYCTLTQHIFYNHEVQYHLLLLSWLTWTQPGGSLLGKSPALHCSWLTQQ